MSLFSVTRVRVDSGLRDGQLSARDIDYYLCHSFLYVDADVPASKPLLEDTYVDLPLLRITYTGYRVGISSKPNHNRTGQRVVRTCSYRQQVGRNSTFLCARHP